MKLSDKWLRDWVNPPLTSQQLSDKLTMAGLEVEGIGSVDGDLVIEFNLTPNRGDCLSVKGLAREIAVLTGCQVTSQPEAKVAPKNSEKLIVEIKAPESCPRYVGRLVKGIRTATTPNWLAERLQKSDINCIHPVVDILNYVMLEMGQPMHAFDADKLHAPVVVRQAQAAEKITLLNGQEVILDEATLVIADQQQALALAGIMGGQECAVSENTQNIFLESALFMPHMIYGKARRYGLHTDSSFRFERGVDPAIQIQAIDRASALIQEICGGEFGPLTEVVVASALPKVETITLRYERLKKLLGHAVPINDCENILQQLGCLLKKNSDHSWQITPPSYRGDITTEIDLIEEVVRVFGYNNIPNSMPVTHLQFTEIAQNKVPLERFKRACVDLGYHEAITYSFVDQSLQQLLFPHREVLELVNPISADMNVMRLSLWPGLLNALKFNQYRQQSRLKIFETGMRFQKNGEQLIQDNVMSGLVCGQVADEQWGAQTRAADFFDVKHDIESLWQLLGQSEALDFTPAEHSACHPGQCAVITWQGENIGILGSLHPKIQKQLELDGPIFLFELQLAILSKTPLPIFARPSRFPDIRRDIAVIVDFTLPSSKLTQFIRNNAGSLLNDLTVFDVYTGKGIEPGSKSVALGLILQHPSRTLVDDEVDSLMQTIIAGLEREFNAKLRD
ncbi:MAG: phenylalanine--tRNA ligase subunit beta [Candidatus Berkiellales bacterium]